MPDPSRFLESHEALVRPLELAANRAWWTANTTGSDAAFAEKEQAQNRLDEALSDRARFQELKSLHDAAGSFPAGVARQIRVLYLQYLEKQVAPELLQKIAAKANAVEKAFNVYRPEVDGREITDGEVRGILRTSRDQGLRERAWKASKDVGRVVFADLIELVRLRNEAASRLGFANYHAMQMALTEQDGSEVLALFDSVDALTREPFLAAKAEMDRALSHAHGIAPNELKPWHYHDLFFQEAPAEGDGALDAPYRKADIVKLSRDFFAGVGLPVHDVLARSDLFERPGKSPHAFCTDIDREGDVRVLANIVPTEYWMSTMLHELGHAVYSSKFIPRDVPYALRTEAHILTTEGIAMLFQRFSKSARWCERMGVPLDDPKAFDAAGRRARRNDLLVFSRWCQVMFRFEKGLYESPGQDLSALWWRLVEKYQGITPPEGRNAPDYAAKIHVCSAPAYYHNYMMGELFASQVLDAMARALAGGKELDVVGNEGVGRFLREKVFAPAKTLPWNELTRFATGEGLSPKAFAAHLA